MTRNEKPWKRQMNQGDRSWKHKEEEKKEQKTLEEFEEEEDERED